MRIQRGTVRVQQGYSEDTVRVQQGYSEDTAGVQSGYSRGTAGVQLVYIRVGAVQEDKSTKSSDQNNVRCAFIMRCFCNVRISQKDTSIRPPCPTQAIRHTILIRRR